MRSDLALEHAQANTTLVNVVIVERHRGHRARFVPVRLVKVKAEARCVRLCAFVSKEAPVMYLPRSKVVDARLRIIFQMAVDGIYAITGDPIHNVSGFCVNNSVTNSVSGLCIGVVCVCVCVGEGVEKRIER